MSKNCEYCSDIIHCCEAWGIDRGWSDSSEFQGSELESFCQVDPPTWRNTSDEVFQDTLHWCAGYCSNCYIDTNQVLSLQSIATADITKDWNIYTVFVFVAVVRFFFSYFRVMTQTHTHTHTHTLSLSHTHAHSFSHTHKDIDSVDSKHSHMVIENCGK